MREIMSGLGAGLLFGGGLAVGGMTDPRIVVGFLDVAGDWNPTLIFVLLGAVVTTFIGYRLVLRRPAPVFAETFALPARSEMDSRLLGGAALFGVGWGLSGYCPGPAVASAASLQPGTLVFLAAMLFGMVCVRYGPTFFGRSSAPAG